MIEDCDTLLMVGSSFPYSEWLPEEGQARAVQIDIDGAHDRDPLPDGGQPRRRRRARRCARCFRCSSARQDRSWREEIERRGRPLVGDPRRARAMQDADPLNPQRVFHELSPRLPDGAILTADSGSATNWWARHLKLRSGMKAALSGTLATMCPAVPYALGAKFAFPDRPVIACVGDGAMQMLGINALIDVAQLHGALEQQAAGHAGAPQRRPQPGHLGAARDVRRPASSRRRRCCRTSRTRATPSCSGCEGIRVDSPDQVGRRWDEAFAHERPGRDRGDHRSRGAAAAAAHPLRAGEAAWRRRSTPATRTARRSSGSAEGQAARVRRPAERRRASRPSSGSTSRRTRSRPTRRSPTGRSSGTRPRSCSSRRAPAGRAGSAAHTATPAIGALIEAKLWPTPSRASTRSTRRRRGRRWRRASATTARPGSAYMAISAVDVALWDLKARLLGLPLARLLGRCHERRPGVRQRRLHLLLATRACASSSPAGRRGHPAGEDEGGRDPAADPERVRAARGAIGDDVELFVDANGAYTRKQALALAERSPSGRVLVRGAGVVGRPGRPAARCATAAPAGMEVAAGEYGYDLPYFRADARGRCRGRPAGRRHPLRRDHRACCAWTRCARARRCRSRRTARRRYTRTRAARAERTVHLEYFHDHVAHRADAVRRRAVAARGRAAARPVAAGARASS